MPTKQTTTIEPSGDGFAVITDGKTIRDGFVSRGHAAMWAARKGLYQGHTPRRKPEIPVSLADEQILKLPLAAKLTGRGYPRFLAEAKAGVWGELFQLGKNIFGVKLGNIKRSLTAAQIK